MSSAPLTLETLLQGPREYELSQLPITFGIEFEFCLAHEPDLITYWKKTDSNPEPKYPRVPWLLQDYEDVGLGIYGGLPFIQRAIARRLRWNKVPCTCRMERGGSGSINEIQQERGPYEWFVDRDGSIRGPNDKYYWYGIELISPAFYFSEVAIEQVKRACGRVASDFCVNVNQTTGLHVHVGNGTAGFDFHTTRNLAAIIWTFENHLNWIHSESRVANYYCQSLTTSNMARSAEVTNRFDMRRAGLEQIWDAKDVNAVINMMSGSNRLNYHFGNLRDQGDNDPKKTIEFRGHAGCLDPERVEHWIRVCVGIVRFARDISPERVKELCLSHVDERGTEGELLQILRKFNLTSDGFYYRLKGRPNSPPGWEEEPTQPTWTGLDQGSDYFTINGPDPQTTINDPDLQTIIW